MQLKLKLIKNRRSKNKQQEEIAGAKIGQQVASDLLSKKQTKKNKLEKILKQVLTLAKDMIKIAIRMSNEITELSLSEHLKLKYRDMMNEHADHIATGACKDFPDYQKMAGIIEGISPCRTRTTRLYRKGSQTIGTRLLKSCKNMSKKEQVTFQNQKALKLLS